MLRSTPANSERRRPAAAVLALAIAMSISACGGGAAVSTDPATAATSGPAADSTSAAPTAGQTGAGGQGAASECSLDAIASCGGSATLTLAGEPVVFDFFGCFTGADAAIAFGQDAATFTGLGQVSVGGGPATLFVAVLERGALVTYQLIYVPSGASNTEWGADNSESEQITVDGDHVAFDGDVIQAVNGTPTGEHVAATLEATCAP
jgi:hypothetical protein